MVSSFKFAVLGDSRGQQSIQVNKPVLGRLLHNIKRYHDPDFILFGGDMIQGRTTSGVDANTAFIYSNLLRWRRFVEEVLGVDSLCGYVYPAVGNHDYSNADNLQEAIRGFNRAFSYLPSAKDDKDMLKGYGKTVYYFDYSNSRFIVLNTVFENSTSGDPNKIQDLVGITKEQLVWLEKVLSTSRRTNNFIMFHSPIIGTKLDYYTLPLDQQEALFRIFNKYNVKVVYCGHEHNYNRRFITNVFYKNDYELNKSIIQVTSGGGGAPLSEPGDKRLNIVNGPVCIYEYGIVEVCGSRVRSTFYNLEGTCIDSFSFE